MTDQSIKLTVNGSQFTLDVDTRATLAELLRDRLGLPGTKIGCARGECGACTVHLDARAALSCLVLAVAASGKSVTTIEGIGATELGRKVQKAFVEHDAFQCGYCTAGQIMSALDLLARGSPVSDLDAGEHMSGNLCRCGAYPNIVAAIRAVQQG